MRGMTALADLIGMAEPVDPSQMRFTTKHGASCHACIFKGQRAAVCREASRLAVLAGLEDCDREVVYVPLPIDTRQLTIE